MKLSREEEPYTIDIFLYYYRGRLVGGGAWREPRRTKLGLMILLEVGLLKFLCSCSCSCFLF